MLMKMMVVMMMNSIYISDLNKKIINMYSDTDDNDTILIANYIFHANLH